MTLIRVMTFNVNGLTYTGPGASPEAHANGWKQRAELNLQTIQRWKPDLIGFQEVQEANLATYQDRLVGYDHVPGNLYAMPSRPNAPRSFGGPHGLNCLHQGSSGTVERPINRPPTGRCPIQWVRPG